MVRHEVYEEIPSTPESQVQVSQPIEEYTGEDPKASPLCSWFGSYVAPPEIKKQRGRPRKNQDKCVTTKVHRISDNDPRLLLRIDAVKMRNEFQKMIVAGINRTEAIKTIAKSYKVTHQQAHDVVGNYM